MLHNFFLGEASWTVLWTKETDIVHCSLKDVNKRQHPRAQLTTGWTLCTKFSQPCTEHIILNTASKVLKFYILQEPTSKFSLVTKPKIFRIVDKAL